MSIHDIVCFVRASHQLYPAEVERAYRRQLELGDEQGWPPPTGYWRDDGMPTDEYSSVGIAGTPMVVPIGRHRYVAALMLGVEYMLVAWVVAPPTLCSRCHGTRFDGHGEACLSCPDR